MSRLHSLLEKKRPLVMGILNVTPDSFSDGGQFLQPELALAHALQMVDEGADIIDVGGESTRPGAVAVEAVDEIARVLPVLKAIRERSDVALSLDTSKASVMAAALDVDVDLINDVQALRSDEALATVADSGLPVCLMHMHGEPRTMQDNPDYSDLLSDIEVFFTDRIEACVQAGVKRDHILLDVGFGFGKTASHNLTLINRLSRFKRFQLPLLVGLSRKSTIGKITGDLVAGSVAGALAAINNGARIIRVHDVAASVAALKVWQSILNEQVTTDG
jgi:dihydropteroate synthase